MKRLMELHLFMGSDCSVTPTECCIADELHELPEPCDWRDEAKLAAETLGWNLKDEDLVDVRSFIVFKIREKHGLFESLACRDVILPGGMVIVDDLETGFPLSLLWEEEITTE